MKKNKEEEQVPKLFPMDLPCYKARMYSYITCTKMSKRKEKKKKGKEKKETAQSINGKGQGRERSRSLKIFNCGVIGI